jgi:hypothetical protein
VIALPRWQARNEREQKAMIDWACYQLDELAEARDRATSKHSAEQVKAARDSIAARDPAIEAAWRRNMAPLRKRHPELAPFLFPPKGTRGIRFPKPVLIDSSNTERRPTHRVLDAAWAVEQLRDVIWPKHFGKKNRHQDDGPSAEQIVAKWMRVSVADIKRWTKPSGTSRAERKNSRAK